MAIPDGGVFLGRAGTGSAYVLGSNLPSALAIYEQGQRARAFAAQREAAARLKEAELIGKRYDEDKKINYDAGGAFQQSFNDYAAPIPGKLVDMYSQLRAGAITQPQLDRQVGDLKSNAERERLLSIDRDKNMSAYQDKELATGYRDRANLRTAFGNTLLNKDRTRIQAGNYDELAAQQQIDNDPLTYLPDKIIDDAIKRRTTSTVAEAYSNGVGGQHGASTYTSNGFLVRAGKDGALETVKASNGLPAMDYSDVDLQRDRSGDHKFDMGIKRLQLDYKTQQAATPGLRDKSDLELYKEAARPYVFFKETQSVGQNAQPHQPRAAAGGKPKANDVVPDSGAFGDYALPAKTDVGRDYSTAKPLYPGGLPIATDRRYAMTQETLGGGGKPMRNNGKEVATVGSQITGIERHDEKGHWVRDVTTKPFAGTYGNWFSDVRDKATGFRVTDKTKAEKVQMLREGKGEVANYINGYSIGKKDYTAAHDETLKKLQAENPATGMAGHKADPVLEDEARRIATTGSEPVVFPYNEQNARVVDPETQNFYRSSLTKRQQIANEMRQQPAQAPPDKPKQQLLGFPAAKQAKATKPQNNLLGF